MRICYVLLSSTFGMHQYTADLANRMVEAGHAVHLVTTAHVPRDRYSEGVEISAPLALRGTGFSPKSLNSRHYQQVRDAIVDTHADVAHFAGPHLWNVPLVRYISARMPVLHTIHDLDPHVGTSYGVLLRFWNDLIARSVDGILVHGHTYSDRLLAIGLPASKIHCTPLTHLFFRSSEAAPRPELPALVEYGPWALFFGRLERYKGVDHLLTALAMMNGEAGERRLVLAGPGNLSTLWPEPVPAGVELRNHFIDDAEAIELFRSCGLLVLPYVDATQSALISAAYCFRKPVVVTRTGALAEYVDDGVTGRIVEPDHPAALARCLTELLDMPARLARMGAAGRNWYDSRRADETRTLLQVYQGLAASRRR